MIQAREPGLLGIVASRLCLVAALSVHFHVEDTKISSQTFEVKPGSVTRPSQTMTNSLTLVTRLPLLQKVLA